VTAAAHSTAPAGRGSVTREAILTAAEQLFAEHGVFAVSNRQVGEAAGQGNNTAVRYHFGTKADLVRAIGRRHERPIERLRLHMVAKSIGSADLRDWVDCLVRPLTEHLAELGNPTWYARFAAQAMADPAYYDIVAGDALSSPTLVEVIDQINHCLPDLPAEVNKARAVMARHLLIHTAADFERALATRTSFPRSSWGATASAIVDAIVGLWAAPVTPHPERGSR
jgi:AcrR family transcriptional regulator